MKFKIERAALLSHLNHVSKALAVRTPLPILTFIKCKVSEEGMLLVASDSDITIQTFLSVDAQTQKTLTVIEAGEIALPGKYFIELIKKSTKELLEITSDEKFQVIIKNGRSKYKLNGFDTVNYPKIEMITNEKRIPLTQLELKQLIQETAFACSMSSSRPILTGVHFLFQNQQLQAVATDSFRLGKTTLPLKQSVEPMDIVIPKKSLMELSKLLTDSEDIVYLAVQRNQVAFEFESMTFQTRLLDGTYPDTKEFVPQTFQTEIGLDIPELYEALDRASLMAKDQTSNVVRLRGDQQEQKIIIIAQSPEIGEIEEEVDANFIKGNTFEVACSSVFLLEALKTFESDEMMIGYNGSMRPLVLFETENEQMLQLIVPVRID